MTKAMDGRDRWRDMACLCLCLALTALWPFVGISADAAAAVDPTFTLQPDHGSCGVPVIARGEHYPPGATVVVEGPYSTTGRLLGHPAAYPRVTVATDGTFSARIVPCTGTTAGTARRGERYLLTADVPTGPGVGTRPTATFTVDQIAASATLTIDPDHLPCNSPDDAVTARGSGFALGTTIVIDAQIDPPKGVVAGRATVGDDGSFVAPLQLRGAIGCDQQYEIDVFPSDATGPAPLLASATLTVSGSARRCFAATDKCLGGRFLDYWQANGGLAQFGFPLTGEQPELLEDGKTYTVQYFERARFELHPENAAPYDVLLGQFGRRVLGGDYLGNADAYRQAIAPVAPTGQGRFFPETGHNVGGRFLAYWEQHGGLAQFGYPLTDERSDTLEDAGPTGRGNYATQYFERARLEYHPENAGTPYEVLLGQFGRRILADNALLAGPFRALYLTDEGVRLRFGRPINAAAQSPGVLQPFEHGRMYYSTAGAGVYRGERMIYVLCGTAERGVTVAGPNAGFFPDTWAEGQDPGGGPGPAPGLYPPQRGFGKVWRENPAVRDCLGYATTPAEIDFPITVQFFASGVFLLSDTSEGRFIYTIHVSRRCNSCGPEGDYERFAAPAP